MRSLATGNREALGILFARHHQTVYALCVRLLMSESAGEDVTQEVFLRILRRANSFSSRSRFTTWLYSVTRNACLDYQRKHRRERSKLTRYALEHTPITDTTDDAHGESLERLRNALDALDSEKREILVLRRFNKLSYPEIAEVCSCSVETARVRFHRALQTLKQAFAESSLAPRQNGRLDSEGLS